MFPLNDFNLVYCALATVTAAVGYKYSRHLDRLPRLGRAFDRHLRSRKSRRDSTASDLSYDTSATPVTELSESDYSVADYPTPTESLADLTEPGTLKRKNREEDDFINSTDDTQESCSSPKKLRIAHDEADQRFEAMVAEQASTECSMPSIRIDLSPMAAVIASPTLTKAAYSIPACKPSAAFSAFAGPSSAFSIASRTTTSERPAWCSAPSTLVDKSAILSDDGRTTSREGAAIKATEETPSVEEIDDPLAAQTHAKSTHITISGEEAEDVKAELKGAKLFIKRGDKEFSTGMLGHVKLLSDKETHAERLVFRREPVWKVSMSVRLRPTVRCSFDEDQGILRITLKEMVEQDDSKSSEQQVVVYALKRGKTSKPDFTQFVKDILKSPQFSETSLQQTA